MIQRMLIVLSAVTLMLWHSVSFAGDITSICGLKWGDPPGTFFSADEYFGNYGNASYYWKQGTGCPELPGVQSIEFDFFKNQLASVSVMANNDSADIIKKHLTQLFGKPFRSDQDVTSYSWWNDNINIFSTYVHDDKSHFFTASIGSKGIDTLGDLHDKNVGNSKVVFDNFAGLALGAEKAKFKSLKFEKEVQGIKVYSLPLDAISLSGIVLKDLRLGFVDDKVTVIYLEVDKDYFTNLKNYCLKAFGNSVLNGHPYRMSWRATSFRADLNSSLTKDNQIEATALQIQPGVPANDDQAAQSEEDSKKAPAEEAKAIEQGSDWVGIKCPSPEQIKDPTAVWFYKGVRALGRHCREVTKGNEKEALRRFDAIQKHNDASPFEADADLYQFIWGYGELEEKIGPTTQFSYDCSNGVCTTKAPWGTKILHGTGASAFYTRVEGSQLSINKDLVLAVKKEGVKLTDKTVLSKVLSRIGFLDYRKANNCEEFDADNREAANAEFPMAVGLADFAVTEGLHEAPLLTKTLIKRVAEGKSTDYAIVNQMKQFCKKATHSSKAE